MKTIKEILGNVHMDKRERKLKKDRYKNLEKRKMEAMMLRNTFPPKDKISRMNYMKGIEQSADFQKELMMMKKLYIGGKKKKQKSLYIITFLI